MRFTRAIMLVLVALTPILWSPASSAQVAVGVSIAIAPPPLPVYDQPPMPDVGYFWTPGYWAYGPEGYYWVPGTWVLPPVVGVLWTPPYWGWSDGVYVLHAGYWGPHIGFYGGINYGFGYDGVGYAGGFWERGVFNYNRTVTNFGQLNVTNVYSKTVINNTSATNVSFNGGSGGTRAQPTPEQEAAAREQHSPPTALQAQHEHASSTNHAMLASVNHGEPAIAATSKPGEFHGHGVVGTREATTNGTGEPRSEHAVNPSTVSHPAGGVTPHPTNAAIAKPHETSPSPHPMGNANAPHPLGNAATGRPPTQGIGPPHGSPPHPTGTVNTPHPTNQARISNPGGMPHPSAAMPPHPPVQGRPPMVQRPPQPHPPVHAAAGGNQNRKPKQ